MEHGMNIAVVGDRDSVYCYAALGLDIYPVDGAEEARSTIERLAEHRYAVIYLTERLASQLEGLLAKYREHFLPAVIPIPGITGNTGCGINSVRQSVERAVGSDIIFGGQ